MEQHLIDILEQTKDNLVVSDAFTKADSKKGVISNYFKFNACIIYKHIV